MREISVFYTICNEKVTIFIVKIFNQDPNTKSKVLFN